MTVEIQFGIFKTLAHDFNGAMEKINGPLRACWGITESHDGLGIYRSRKHIVLQQTENYLGTVTRLNLVPVYRLKQEQVCFVCGIQGPWSASQNKEPKTVEWSAVDYKPEPEPQGFLLIPLELFNV